MSTLICKACAQPIRGSYLTALDATWHPEHFRCAVCQKAVDSKRFYTHNGQPCHVACYENRIAKRCAHCNKPILGNTQFYEHKRRTYHTACYEQHIAKRCAHCNKPVFGNTQFYKHEGRSYHADCYERHIAKRCTHCNKALMGRYQFNHWGDHFCVEHTKQYPPCSYCGRLVPHISRRSRRRSVEDVRCDICASTAIESAPQAKHLMPQLIAWVEAQGLIFRKKTFRLEVLDRAEFLSRDGHRDPLGLTTTTRYMRNKRLDRIEVNSVAILQGLPHALFEGVCVHELGHVWMAQHKIVGLPKVEEEGVCELLSHRHYLSIGSKVDLYHAECIAKNSSPIYGDGFRKLKRLEERVGFAQIIKSLQRKKKLPL